MIPADDRGLTLGDGLFETVLAKDGALVDWDAHLSRLAQGCAVLGLPPPDEAGALRLAQAALASAGLDQARAAVRVTLTAGSGGRGLDRPTPLRPRMFATAAPATPPAGPARLTTSAVRRNADSPVSRHKTLAYLDNVLARAEAQAAGADEAVMLNTRGELACASAANLFWIREGRLETPDLACGVLAGVMRARVLAAAAELGVPAAEVRASESVLKQAEAVFLTNSLIGVREAASWNGRSFAPSALVARLAARAEP